MPHSPRLRDNTQEARVRCLFLKAAFALPSDHCLLAGTGKRVQIINPGSFTNVSPGPAAIRRESGVHRMKIAKGVA